MANTAFQKVYKRLNPEQKKAVDAIEGPVMVIAGPGTGKTQILTLRIANILRQTDTSPDSILALTFTESGVFSMRKRLVEFIGSAGYRVNIHTFHGFCNTLIQRYPDEFPDIIGAQHIGDADKILLLQEIIRGTRLKILKPFGDPFFYLNPVRGAISELKREHISPKELRKRLREEKARFKQIDDLYHEKGPHKGLMKGKYRELQRQLEKNEELCTLYELYEGELEKRRYYDYEDMIVKTIRALEKKKDLLLRVQEEYQYILADEHQDANNSQNRLLELLSNYHEEPNLFVVGDEKQAIYRFQGASVENFLRFRKLYPSALVISLVDNYRSTQGILDAAGSLIEKGKSDPAIPRMPLRSHAESSAVSVNVWSVSRQDLEHVLLVRQVKDLIAQGAVPQEIAVLYRTNKDAEAIARRFEKEGVPFAIESDQDVLKDLQVQKLLLLLKVVNDFGNDALLHKALHIDFLGFAGLDIHRLLRHANDQHMPLFAVLKSESSLRKTGIEKPGTFTTLYKNLARWEKMSHNESVLKLFETISSESGFLDAVLESPDSLEKLDKLRSLFSHIEKVVERHRTFGLTDLIQYLDLLERYDLPIKKTSRLLVPEKVRLMTAHKSKGLEFDYVFIADAHDGHWGNRKTINHFTVSDTDRQVGEGEEQDDERRLFYVAITRARTSVSIFYAQENAEGRPQLPSQFLEEIDTRFVEQEDAAVQEQTIHAADLLRPAPTHTAPVHDKTFLNDLFLSQGLSVTALNNYLVCPWRYFYNNLVRIPRAPDKRLLFGTAIHRSLRDLFEKVRTGEDPTTVWLLEAFDRHIKKLPLREEEFEELKEKGHRALTGYHKVYHGTWIRDTKNEFPIRVLFDAGAVGMLPLRGDLDKLEFLGSGGDVNVVDYKTGKQKSRNEIEGKTKTATGDYKRQLLFYRLLLDLYDGGKFTMVSGEIDFIEPNERGKFRKERFFIEPAQVAGLSDTITAVAQEILDLAFWDKTCNDPACDYCALRRLMHS
jgi:DNA helicase-2/ATP-dependent DNA helicase PcrA